MQIVEAVVHNFRSFSDARIELGDCSLLVGANNCGKSNFLDAIALFYDKVKFSPHADVPKFVTSDQETWIEVEFALADLEAEQLADQYLLPDNRLRIRKYVRAVTPGPDGKPLGGTRGYTQDGLSEEQFYGWKNVAQGKLGNVVVIPAVSRLTEQTKMSGPSPFRDLLNQILGGLAATSVAVGQLKDRFDEFVREVRDEETAEARSLTGLEADINAGIEGWGARFCLDITGITEADILRGLVTYSIRDPHLEGDLDAGQFGEGFQRQLIFSIIQTAAKYQVPAPPKGKKDFSGDLTVLLFEEPEAYLHPGQQRCLSKTLREMASAPGFQVILSTHSPLFVSQSMDDVPSIARLVRDGGRSTVGQVDAAGLTSICQDNQRLNHVLQAEGKNVNADDLTEDMEAIKYGLWFDPDRCGVFFAEHVLLVEGPSERALVNFLMADGRLNAPAREPFVLDCMGMYNIHRFMNILTALGVSHSVLYDDDNGRLPGVSGLIRDSSSALTRKIECFPDDLEAALGIAKTPLKHRKPQHVMYKLTHGEVQKSNLDAFLAKVEPLLSPAK